MPPSSPLNAQRLRTTLKMAISKLKFLQDKKSALCKQQRRQLADLLSSGKETSAKIRVENIIRDDVYIELLEYCELFCELLLARSQIVLDASRTEVDGGLQDAVASVIYCCNLTEIKELVTLGDMLRLRYGPEYSRKVLENEGGDLVPPKVVSRCDIEPPSEALVNLYLSEIARTYEVPFSGLVEDETASISGSGTDEEDSPSGGAKELAGDEPVNKNINVNKSRSKEAPLAADQVTSPLEAPKKQATKAQTEQSEFDKLQQRFAALKK